MELRQLRYFVKVVECGSLGRAATELGVVTSALSQQISRLEGELSTRLLTRTSTGVVLTDAGLAFLRQAQLSLRHADDAMKAARESRLSGHVSIGLVQTTASVLALPFMRAMRQRYPDVRLRLVESLSGHLSTMLNARQLDLAIVFQTETARRWSVMPLLDESLFLIARDDMPGLPPAGRVRLRDLTGLPLLLPSDSHGLRALVNNGFARFNERPDLVAEIDGLDVLMELVEAGLGATIQPGAATVRLRGAPLATRQIRDRQLARSNLLVSLSDDELSPAALAVRVLLAQVAADLVRAGAWPGATLHKS
ncbi:LysR substrate-binding domain-containing protein [Bordetella holmesii]|uniref:LysR substrate-binding domain protein n=2 Tax=Bordetella holmesii TaxID=35814 RepID=A0A158M732_9BORD|nr:LysR substrate-binding domain-containing protein [Bordetella holmesii]AIT25700.1 bacterial regulatory helix-turn-helix, lysR family protein [Bordetella holmesii 44057]EWM43007.1 bacterial regulatory helix-turn-helix, lysR family protein [Bordetella holmesii 41130]EWM46270.1 bacterial regulatory helix-turn-helix, lysR family protein [Bordetella holmesii 35009]EWM50425.1 bacterial regulatory helix-turn-helix, lysR family protein [Bordetella holmesii 70147]AMD44842.1 LysR family transcriptiona